MIIFNATPRPWGVNGGDCDPTWIDGPASEPVATTAHGDLKYLVQVANAALIVQAVNEREALLAVVEAASNWIKREDLALEELQVKYGVLKDSGPIPEMELLRQAISKTTR